MIAVAFLHPLPNDKILGLPKLIAFADDKLNNTQNIRFVFHRIEKTLWEKKKMLVTSIFFFSHNVFKRFFPSVRPRLSLCGTGLIFLYQYTTQLFFFSHKLLPPMTVIKTIIRKRVFF